MEPILSISRLLHVSDADISAKGWPAILDAGLPMDAFRSIATSLTMPQKKLAAALGVSVPTKKMVTLDVPLSDLLFRVAQSLAELQRVPGWALPDCAKWLKAPCASLKGRVPLELHQSSIGCEYVTTAIQRGPAR